MDEKIYIGKTTDFDKEKVVSDEPDERILDMVYLLEIHRSEIKEWFCILDIVKDTTSKWYLINKPLSIEISEFVLGCRRLYNEINSAVRKLNKMYQSKGRSGGLRYLDRSIKDSLHDKIFDSIEEARNQVSAHRYTDKNMEFITLGKMARHYSKISVNNLTKAWNVAENAFEELKAWLKEDINQSHLILLKELKNQGIP